MDRIKKHIKKQWIMAMGQYHVSLAPARSDCLLAGRSVLKEGDYLKAKAFIIKTYKRPHSHLKNLIILKLSKFNNNGNYI